MRKEARISTAVWRNRSFTSLPLACQGLYWMLLSQPDVSMCGVLPYLPARWAAMCGSEDIDKALGILEDAGTVVVDRDTSEVLIRTFVRHDGVLRSPKTRAGMWKAWDSVLSDKLRAVILDQASSYVEEAVTEEWVTRREVESVPPYDPAPAAENGVADTPPDTPSDEGLDTPSDRGSPRARASSATTSTSSSTGLGGKPPSNRDEMFEAVAQVCGIDWQAGLTKTERGEVNNAVKQLRDIEAPVDQVHAKARAYRKRWPEMDLTPSALVKHWSKIDAPKAGDVRALRADTCHLCGFALDGHDDETCTAVQEARSA